MKKDIKTRILQELRYDSPNDEVRRKVLEDAAFEIERLEELLDIEKKLVNACQLLLASYIKEANND